MTEWAPDWSTWLKGMDMETHDWSADDLSSIEATPTTLASRLTTVRRLLAGVVAVDDLDLQAAGYLQWASAELLDTAHPPLPLEPPTASSNVMADLTATLDLLQVRGLLPVKESIQLALVERYVREATAHLPTMKPLDSAQHGAPMDAGSLTDERPGSPDD